jgi:glycosyltransferase involved in cell wall biosynthesis
MPRLSIITVTFNAVEELPQTLISLEPITHQDIEIVVVDGGSKDGTVEWIQAHPEKVHAWISEKDKGIYDAMNKGLKLAKGEFVWFLNAGDYLFNAESLKELFQQDASFDLYYGDTEMISLNGTSLGLRRGGVPEQLTVDTLKTGMKVSHQSLIVRRSIAPEFDASYRLTGDLDWLIRLVKKDIKIKNLNKIVSKFTIGGASGQQWWKAMKERWRCLEHHYGFWTTLWAHLRIILNAPFAHARFRH